MAVMDEFKEQREGLKSKSLKDKFIYFLDYYKWYVIIGVIAIVMIGTLIKDMVTAKEDALYGVFVNAYAADEDKSTAFKNDFAGYAGIDLNKFDIVLDASLRMTEEVSESTMTASQLIMVYTAAQDLDVLAMDEQNFSKYANNEYFLDLSTFLSPEQMEKYKEHLYYVDMAVIESVDDTALATDENYVVAYPDPSRPEDMEKPMAVGINLQTSERFYDTYLYAQDTAFIGIIGNSARPDSAIQFIKYLFEE